LTIHGLEPERTPPLFHADELLVDFRVDSILRRKISGGTSGEQPCQRDQRVATATGRSPIPAGIDMVGSRWVHREGI